MRGWDPVPVVSRPAGRIKGWRWVRWRGARHHTFPSPPRLHSSDGAVVRQVSEEGGGDAHRVLDVVVEIGRVALGMEAVVNLVARRVGAWPRRYGRWRTRRFVYLFQLMLRFPPWGEEADYHLENAVLHTTSACESNQKRLILLRTYQVLN